VVRFWYDSHVVDAPGDGNGDGAAATTASGLDGTVEYQTATRGDA
jgi:hypothetical protein